MGRRHVKEFRPDEALSLISTDRAGGTAACPCCGSGTVTRSPARPRDGHAVLGPVTLTCPACGRVVTYIDRGAERPEKLEHRAEVRPATRQPALRSRKR